MQAPSFAAAAPVAGAYAVALEHLDGEVIARVPLLDEVLTGADNEAEALTMVADALEEAVLTRLARGEAVPLPGPVIAGEPVALLPPITAARVLIDHERRAKGWSKSDLAREMGRDEKVARRLLDGRGAVTMDLAALALKALGRSITLAWS